MRIYTDPRTALPTHQQKLCQRVAHLSGQNQRRRAGCSSCFDNISHTCAEFYRAPKKDTAVSTSSPADTRIVKANKCYSQARTPPRPAKTSARVQAAAPTFMTHADVRNTSERHSRTALPFHIQQVLSTKDMRTSPACQNQRTRAGCSSASVTAAWASSPSHAPCQGPYLYQHFFLFPSQPLHCMFTEV
jgi:hypothetical protein